MYAFHFGFSDSSLVSVVVLDGFEDGDKPVGSVEKTVSVCQRLRSSVLNHKSLRLLQAHASYPEP